jgi:hypothetical protein
MQVFQMIDGLRTPVIDCPIHEDQGRNPVSAGAPRCSFEKRSKIGSPRPATSVSIAFRTKIEPSGCRSEERGEREKGFPDCR